MSKRAKKKAKRKQDLYVFQMLTLFRLSVLNKTERTLLFHRRMGHLNLKSLPLLSHLSEGIILDKDPSTLCEVCQQAKAKKTTFSCSTSLSRIGELTHADICSVDYPTVIGKKTMFLILVDDATRYTTIALLTHKSDAASHIIACDKTIVNKTGKHIFIFKVMVVGNFLTIL
jgi:hypothetical protein